MKTGKILSSILSGSLCTFFVGLMAAAAPVDAQVPAQPVIMRLATTTTNDADVEWLETFGQGVQVRSNGRIRFELYPSGQLGSAQRTAEGVVLGTVAVTLNASGFFESLEPRFGIFSAPGLFDSMEHGNQVLNDPEIRTLISEYGKGKGYEVLTAFMHTPMTLVTRDPYIKNEDLQGRKIRVPGFPLYINMFRSLGAAPLSMSLPEVLPAMQNRTIDGAMGGNTVFSALKFYDITANMTWLPATHVVVTAIISTSFLDRLSPELRTIIRQEAYKADQHIYRWGVEDVNRKRLEWEVNGGKSHTLDAQAAQAFTAIATQTAREIFSANPQQMQDWERFRTIAQKYR